MMTTGAIAIEIYFITLPQTNSPIRARDTLPKLSNIGWGHQYLQWEPRPLALPWLRLVYTILEVWLEVPVNIIILTSLLWQVDIYKIETWRRLSWENSAQWTVETAASYGETQSHIETIMLHYAELKSGLCHGYTVKKKKKKKKKQLASYTCLDTARNLTMISLHCNESLFSLSGCKFTWSDGSMTSGVSPCRSKMLANPAW